ncbi:peptidase M4 [Bacillus sp. LL01]|uniref:PepSY domain-containing protein n=1 Tax=Bacillus sp. LL01 TaxID=1665556 RepID=UPI00064D0A09|nr:PepSY domain-containing protein [Bacillus sp. LL01]KMJ57085.1 peptidase M4 [Bacillus sp. LL01]
MRWKVLLIGAGIGAAAAYFFTEASKQQAIKPEKALKIAKEAFKKRGPVDGSWIQMVPETIIRNDMSYSIYRGGISRRLDDVLEQYEFIVDKNTGVILDVNQLK